MELASDFYLLRTTLLPVNILDLNDEQFDFLFSKLLKTDFFKEAIYVASTDLYYEMEKLNTNQLLEQKKIDKLKCTLYKYIFRMCGRPIPFGLFSGIALGEVTGHDTCLQYGKKELHQKIVRLDISILILILKTLMQTDEIKNQSNYSINNTIYKIDKNYRYVNTTFINGKACYELQQVESSASLDKIIRKAKSSCNINELSQSLINKDIDIELATDFVNELINEKILVNDIEPCLIIDSPLHTFLNNIQNYKGIDKLKIKAEQLANNLGPNKIGIGKYFQITENVKQIVNSDLHKNTVHVDLLVDMNKNQISKNVLDEIVDLTKELKPLSHRRQNIDLANFINNFRDKFGESEIPLSLAIDSEYGIGYGNQNVVRSDFHSLLSGLSFDKSNERYIKDDLFTQLEIKKFKQAITLNQKVVQLEQEDIGEFLKTEKGFELPESMYVMGSIIASNIDELTSGNYYFELASISGPSAANLMARFGLLNKTLGEKLKDIVEKIEKNHEDIIYAEVVHIPETKVGNISARPSFYSYEIPYLSKGQGENIIQILLNDILVTVRQGEIILRSKKHNKRIIPCLTSAHNHNVNSLPLYQFLCDLRVQNLLVPFNWKWNLFEDELFLPRVVYKKLILQKAQWKISLETHPEITKLSGSALSEYIEALREKLSIPAKVCISYRDMELPLNLELRHSQELLRSELIKIKKLGLTEFLMDKNNCVISNDNDRYVNEIIIPIATTNNVQFQELKPTAGKKYVRKSFKPGSDWLYYKFYSGTFTADKILLKIVPKIVNEFTRQNLIEKWFFIRYLDPNPHLRLRFKFKNAKDICHGIHIITEQLNQPAFRSAIYKTQIDTYERELERYMHSSIELSESVFWNDSLFVIGILKKIANYDLDEDTRLLVAIKGVNNYLSAIELNEHEKYELMNILSNGFMNEFGNDPLLKKQINEKYRQYAPVIYSAYADKNNQMQLFKKDIDNHYLTLKKIINESVLRQDKKKLIDITESFIHMFLNRLFTSNQRKFEVVVYSFLAKFFDSLLKRDKTY
ncbi:lantibiotic dehydratase [Parafilimonas sp.]|uniref:lantibiotic dehydratase n=1 Tax=Parafilimonas sp. TaxID=1969739 RepID=UPI0039E22418